MGRINGINSDYALQNGAVAEVDPQPAELELKMFICPPGFDNALQSEGPVCTGTDGACPAPGSTEGHAMLHLSQTDGLRLVTDAGTELRLHQNDTTPPNADPDAGMIVLHPAAAKVRIDGALDLVAGGRTVTITPSGAGISIASGGTEIVLKSNGDLDLITQNNTGTVNILGNLVVSGTLSRQGQII